MNWHILGRYLVTAGVIIVFLGVLFLMADRFFVGRLPGDFTLRTGENRITIPFATIALVGVAITLIVNFFSKS